MSVANQNSSSAWYLGNTASSAQGQTADRAFSITITVGINNSGQFN